MLSTEAAAAAAAAGQSSTGDGSESPRIRPTLVNFAGGVVGRTPVVNRQGSRDVAVLRNDDSKDLATEATGISASCDDWRSSWDGSDAAGLGASLDADFDTNASCTDGRASMCVSNDGATAGCSMASSGCQPTSEVLEEAYGPVVRVLGPGESFGELALLSKNATRTATVMVGDPDSCRSAAINAPGTVDGGMAGGSQQPEAEPATGSRANAATGGAVLIRISRTCYDGTVRSLQVGVIPTWNRLCPGIFRQ